MVFKECTKKRILQYNRQGYSSQRIADLLKEEGVRVTYSGATKFLTCFKITRTTSRHPGSGRPPKVTAAVKSIVDLQMEIDETTAVQLLAILSCNGYSISLSTILRCRRSLGWTFRGSAYSQMIREANKRDWSGCTCTPTRRRLAFSLLTYLVPLVLYFLCVCSFMHIVCLRREP